MKYDSKGVENIPNTHDWPDRNTTRPRWANGDTGIMYWRVYDDIEEYGPGWQKCPVCEGTGKEFRFADSGGNNYKDCPTCEGKRIIDKLTGKPPK